MSASVTATEAASTGGTGVRGPTVGSDWCYPSNPPRSPNLAWLNVVGGVGIGQLVLGQVKKGVLLMIGGNVLIMIVLLLVNDGNDASSWFSLLYIAMVVASTIDAFKVGKRLFRGQPVRQFDWFPSGR